MALAPWWAFRPAMNAIINLQLNLNYQSLKSLRNRKTLLTIHHAMLAKAKWSTLAHLAASRVVKCASRLMIGSSNRESAAKRLLIACATGWFLVSATGAAQFRSPMTKKVIHMLFQKINFRSCCQRLMIINQILLVAVRLQSVTNS